MVSTATTHAAAMRKARTHGAAVAFSHITLGAYVPSTDTFANPTAPTVAGFAVEIPQEPAELTALSLVPSETVVLMFVPQIIGQLPMLNSVLQWAGAQRVVKGVLPIRPAGVALAAKVFVT